MFQSSRMMSSSLPLLCSRLLWLSPRSDLLRLRGLYGLLELLLGLRGSLEVLGIGGSDLSKAIIVLGVNEGHHIRQLGSDTLSTTGVMRELNLHLNTQHSLQHRERGKERREEKKVRRMKMREMVMVLTEALWVCLRQCSARLQGREGMDSANSRTIWIRQG